MNILLTAINAKYIHSNLAVYSLRAYVPEYREEIQIAEYTINQQVDNILMDLYRKKPDILCFSCYIWNLDYVEQLVREAGKILPGVPIWIGGPEVSYDSPAVLQRLPEVFGVMKGEGEETFRELVHYYMEGGSLEKIDGITYRGEKGQILDYHESLMTHAMTFMGVNLDENGNPDRWRVENSWGEKSGKKGYYVMSDAWFDEYMYQVVVNKKYLPEQFVKEYESEPILLEPWDPMGSLAL